MRIHIISIFLAFIALSACTGAPPAPELPALTKASSANCVDTQEWAYSVRRGSQAFSSTCAYCHQSSGRGQAGEVPALAGNAQLMADPDRGIRMIRVTQSPAARTHGMEYDDMVAILGELDDNDVADVLNYVLSSWGNCAGPIDADRVRAVTATMKN